MAGVKITLLISKEGTVDARYPSTALYCKAEVWPEKIVLGEWNDVTCASCIKKAGRKHYNSRLPCSDCGCQDGNHANECEWVIANQTK